MKRALLIASLALLAPWRTSASVTNILLIIADDLGADSSSLYNTTNTGASLPPTPNLNALAQTGLRFANAYANPVCSPTRACILTGRYSFRTGIGDAVVGAGSPILSANEFTLPEALTGKYQLAHFGKWHLANGANTPATLGGWPHYAGNLIGAIANYTNWTKTINGTATTTTNYATTDVVDDATAWIATRGTNAWFAWVAFNAPHTPLHKPPNSLCPHYTTLTGTPADISAQPRAYFEAMTEALDTEIGRLLTAVNLTNTHVIFLGDNGTTPNVLQPPYPAGRGKGSLYEGGIKIPLIHAGPGIPTGTNTTPIHVIDLYTTILNLAGIATPATTNTIDSLNLFTAGTNRHVYTEQFGTNLTTATAGRTLRGAQYKLIQFDDHHDEFYDLLADPYETTNLLTLGLSPTQLANYYSLILKLGDYQTALAPPTLTGLTTLSNRFVATVSRVTNQTYTLWRAGTLDPLAWSPANALIITNSATSLSLIDTNPVTSQQFYRIGASSP